MSDYNVGDKVNIFIAFENQNNKITFENCFYVENITILEKLEHFENSYYCSLDFIQNIKPLTVSDGSFIPKSGYKLYFNPQRDIEFAPSYGACFVVCKSNAVASENCKKILQNKLFNYLIKDSEKRINALEIELKEEKENLNGFKKLVC
jgi:hypothetical protein